MASKKDPRRLNLAVPYQAPVRSNDVDAGSSMASIMPMAAMMTRNRYIGWGSVVYSLVNWLGESEETQSATSGFFSLGMSFMALLVTYLPVFLPTPGQKTAPPAAATPVPVA